jgi:hypothetical protein
VVLHGVAEVLLRRRAAAARQHFRLSARE